MTYTTVQGDMWDRISFQLFGTEAYMTQLMEANPEHVHTVVFRANITLKVPEISQADRTTLPPWKQEG